MGESFELKRTILFSFLSMVVSLGALPAGAQVNPEAAPGAGQATPYKYEAYVGVAYTRFRQATQTFSGLVGGKATLARDWGKYFQLMGSADYYRVGTGHSGLPNPGNPSVYSILVGPALHATIYESLSGTIFGELGIEHTGGQGMSPNNSFAGGFGGGLAYDLSRNFAVELTGDRVGASFPLPNNNASPNSAIQQQAGSTHRTWNARGTFGLVYRF